jgi:hypothetical protein
MWPMGRDIADLRYNRYFELAPDTRELFPSDMERQRIELMDMVAVLVGSLDERPLFQSLIWSRIQVVSTPDLAFSHRNLSQWARR